MRYRQVAVNWLAEKRQVVGSAICALFGEPKVPEPPHKNSSPSACKAEGRTPTKGCFPFTRVLAGEGHTLDIGQRVRAVGKNVLQFRAGDSGNRVIIGDGAVLQNLKVTFKGSGSRLRLGGGSRLTGHILIVGKNRAVSIGERTTAQGIYILSRDADVIIGSDCMFSREIEVRSTDVHKLYDRGTGEQVNTPGDVVIGDGVWVAARAFVSKGARIPDGCVVGASSLVNRPFDEANVVIAGVPARVVRRNVRWER